MHICYITLANGARFNALGTSRDKAIQNCMTIWHIDSSSIKDCKVKFYASNGVGTCKYGHLTPRMYEPIAERGI